MEETKITINTPISEIERVAGLIGEGLKPKFAAGDYPHACSDLIHLNVVTILSEISTKLSLPLSKIKTDRKLVMWWMDGMPVMRILMNAIPYWYELDLHVLDAPIIRNRGEKELEAIPEDVGTSCYLFCMFAVWYGAKSECKRQLLNNHATKVLNNAIKKLGAKGIMSQLWMAATQYVVLGEKLIEPIWKQMISGKDETKVNSMSSSHITTQTSRRNNKEVSSFADLAKLKQDNINTLK